MNYLHLTFYCVYLSWSVSLHLDALNLLCNFDMLIASSSMYDYKQCLFNMLKFYSALVPAVRQKIRIDVMEHTVHYAMRNVTV